MRKDAGDSASPGKGTIGYSTHDTYFGAPIHYAYAPPGKQGADLSGYQGEFRVGTAVGTTENGYVFQMHILKVIKGIESFGLSMSLAVLNIRQGLVCYIFCVNEYSEGNE
jgi:hypothetical protein